MRKVPKAFFGSLSDQKKLVRSMVVPHKVSGGWAAMTSPIDIRDGRVNVGRGSGVRVFAASRSAMNAAFSLVFGRMKTDMLSCVGPRYSSGSGNNRPSLFNEDNMLLADGTRQK
jgi:hypothetical protein